MKRASGFLLVGWRVLLLLGAVLFLTHNLHAKETPVEEEFGVAARTSYLELRQSIENAIASETRSLAEVTKEIGRLDIMERAVQTELNAYRILTSAHNNLLLSEGTAVKDLEKALKESRQTTDSIGERVREFSKRQENMRALMDRAREQTALNEEQLAEITNASRWPQGEKDALEASLRKLIQAISDKFGLLEGLHGRLGTMVAGLKAAMQASKSLSEKLERQIKSRVKQALFQKKYTSLKNLRGESIAAEFSKLAEGIRLALARPFSADEGLKLTVTGTMPVITLLLLLTVAAVVMVRFRAFCMRLEGRPVLQEHSWRLISLHLIRRSVFLLGTAAVLFGYDLLQFPGYPVPFVRLILNLIFVILVSRWALDFMRLWQPTENRRFMLAAVPRIRMLVVFLALLTVSYLVVNWAVGSDSAILFVERVIIEIALLACCRAFWRMFRRAREAGAGNQPQTVPSTQTVAVGLSYLVVLGGLIMEFAGYGSLATYWYVSWAKTLTVVFWATILFRVIREWMEENGLPSSAVALDSSPSGHPLTWVYTRGAWLLWTISALFGLVLAWSTNWDVFMAVYAFMVHPVAIGRVNVTLSGLIYAPLILFLTHLLTRIARFLFVERFFSHSDIEPGLKVSITAISVYLLWGLGLVMALSVLGVSTTSLAVVFGALSIGIGFGLQNIFNNFISGIILLFERPIQVGDAVEIGGIWGVVKRVNVRATVVQTYDNASLIIPNSEFISSQVTNWSFKDQSMRRRLSVGVAYGSDVELVRSTLLEIANQTKNVLDGPKPDVLFEDHGDSALIFTLRYWTTADYVWTTATDIRFGIDRLFRERGIEIAFPQRDIHIRSITKT
ncbi:mechanosensitive ion channel domain-containing protein [Thermodesulfobacteriota bacterium]